MDIRIGQSKTLPDRRPLVTICRLQGPREGEAYCFHSYCWQLLIKDNIRVGPEYIFRFARSSALIYTLPTRVGGHVVDFTLHYGLDRLSLEEDSGCAAEVDRHDQTGLSTILARVYALPAEIVLEIWKHLDSCATRSLITIKSGAVADLLDRIVLSKTGWSGVLCPSDRVTVSLVSVKGTKYLCGLDDGKNQHGYPGQAILSACIPRQINEVRFIISAYGIRGIKFLGQTGSSNWIGDRTVGSEGETWVGIIRSRSMMLKLQLSWDVGT